MLWTTPESLGERLPRTDPAGTLAITADARIDNRQELIGRLNLRDRPAGEITDSDLILRAYERWGDACVAQLVGDFAFAIWDGRQQQLLCARDHLGVKPFYYYASREVFIFASEIRAILAHPAVPRRLNERRLGDHLAHLFDDRASTFYEGILRLPAAHALAASPVGVRVRRYFAFDPSQEVRLGSDEAYAEAFGELFQDSVRCRVRSHYPVGSTLSGGLDSSSVARTALKFVGQEAEPPLHTFSVIFPGLSGADLRRVDEQSFMDSVLSVDGFQPHFIHADRIGPLTEIERVLWHQEEPLLAPNLYLHWAMHKAAQQQGVRVFLDGIDGDTTVSHGLEFLPELARTGRWKTLLAESRALAQQPGSRVRTRRIVWQYGFKPLVPPQWLKRWQGLRGSSALDPMAELALNPVFARAIGLEQRLRRLAAPSRPAAGSARSEHWQSLSSPLIQYALEVLDKTTAAFDLEARYPFFDRRLMAFCLALPPQQKLSGGWSRIILRRAMSGILPPAVQWRNSKADLSPNFVRWMSDFAKRELDGLLQTKGHLIEPYVDIQALRARLADVSNRQANAHMLFGIVTLAHWLQRAELVPEPSGLCA
jgi:asparagine synthase (glutamine-hydrolysing)